MAVAASGSMSGGFILISPSAPLCWGAYIFAVVTLEQVAQPSIAEHSPVLAFTFRTVRQLLDPDRRHSRKPLLCDVGGAGNGIQCVGFTDNPTVVIHQPVRPVGPYSRREA
jgi:hypothetical protein